jgi:Fe-S-cluster-containing hydrogenase component 2
MFYNPDTDKAIKCNLCDGQPACADACPTAAIEYVDAETSDWLGSFAAARAAGQLTAVAASA